MLIISMSKKKDRLSKIKNFLRRQSVAVTISEIHDALSKRMHLEVSRKTIERDVKDLVDQASLIEIIGVPSRFLISKDTEIDVRLKCDEVRTILSFLDPLSDLYRKLKRELD
jgi:predicted DNA-binding transcriptional regulator YafY